MIQNAVAQPTPLPAPPGFGRRLLGAVLGGFAGALLGAVLGVLHWASARYLLGLDEEFKRGVIGGLFQALAGLLVFPLFGATYGGAAGAVVGAVVGASESRQAAFCAAVFGACFGALGGGTAGWLFAGSAAAAVEEALGGSILGAVVGAGLAAVAARKLRPSRLSRVPFGAALGVVTGTAVSPVVGMLLPLEWTDTNAKVLAIWLGGPLAGAVAVGVLARLLRPQVPRPTPSPRGASLDTATK